jgi:hypothetical protein
MIAFIKKPSLSRIIQLLNVMQAVLGRVDIFRNAQDFCYFCTGQGAFPQEYRGYFKGKQHSTVRKGRG